MSTPPELPAPHRASFMQVNRTRLRVWEWGDPGAPEVVTAHGAFDHGRMFDGLAPVLAEAGYHVLAPDLRGHGDSGPVETGHTFEASVLDLGVLTRSFGRPVGLLGHSMGSGMLFGVAATWPEAAKWLISLDGLGPPTSEFAGWAIDERAKGGIEGLVKTLRRSRRPFPDTEAMVDQRGAVNRRVPRPWLEHLVTHGSTEADEGRVWKWDPLFNTGLPDGFDPTWVTMDFAAVECPVLALMGAAEDTWGFPSEEIPERSSHLRDVEIHEIEDAGHYVHLEQPAVVADHIHRFLDRVDR